MKKSFILMPVPDGRKMITKMPVMVTEADTKKPLTTGAILGRVRKKFRIVAILWLFFLNTLNAFCQDANNTLAPLLNFNFAGTNSWTNLTPSVSYGWTKNITPKKIFGKDVNHFNWELQVGPYVGTTISIKDSTSYLPALMLPGNAGFEVNNYFIFGDTTQVSLTAAPSFGLKVISGFTDSSISIVQHNVAIMAALRYSDYIVLTAQYFFAWHNASDYSEQKFGKLFKEDPRQVNYFILSIHTKLAKLGTPQSPLYLNLSWRDFVSESINYLPNHRIFTIGFSANLELKGATSRKAINKAAFL